MLAAEGADGINVVSTLVAPIQETFNSSLSGALPFVGTAFAVLLGVGVVLKLVKKGTKS